MPTTRRYRPRTASESVDWRYYALRDLSRPDEVQAPPLHIVPWPLEDEWHRHSDAILREWVKAHPGTRPSMWWAFDAPDERERIGGTGMPYSVALPGSPESYFKGMPNRWWTTGSQSFLESSWPKRIASPAAVAYDPADPPTFEAEGVFLERHGLLMKGERVTDRTPEACPLEPFLDFMRNLR